MVWRELKTDSFPSVSPVPECHITPCEMNHTRLNYLFVIVLAATLAAAAAGCASIGNPSGGPRDEAPPRYVRSNPPQGAVNVDVAPRRIQIDFDEIVNVKDAFSKVVVSPVGKSVPRVSSQGRRVTVQFNDSLVPNATYTIDFGNSIEDNNESNKLQGFSYSFATGPVIDTLRISGMVLGARDLEPQQGVLVGAYSNTADSAFRTLPMERVAKTDDRGRFTIRGLAPGSYRVFALNDLDNDYFRANPEEEMAFLPYLVSPSAERIQVTDTIYNLNDGTVDTITTRTATRYLPNDILLRSFSSDCKPQYVDKYERIDSTRLFLKFGAKQKSVPAVDVIGFPGCRGMLMERNESSDSITVWITDPALVSTDTLKVAVTFMQADSLMNPVPRTDTLRFITERPKIKEKKKKKDKDEEEVDTVAVPTVKLVDMRMVTGRQQEVWCPLMMETGTPVAAIDSAAFRLEEKYDSVWKPSSQKFAISRADSLNTRRWLIESAWKYDTDYRLTVDSLAVKDVYGLHSGGLIHEFKTKSEDEYCSLTFNITGRNDSVPAFVELLNNDNVVRTGRVSGGSVTFRFLAPGRYYARIIDDLNGNGLFDTGDYDSLRQPDVAYYYPKAVNVKKNWDKMETWDVFATAVDLQKPHAIKKNKPDADKRRRDSRDSGREEEEDEEEYFDPTRNPFDPNDRGRRRNEGGLPAR